MVQVPYRGAGPAINDLIGGQVPMSVMALTGQVIGFHRSGKLRVLAMTRACPQLNDSQASDCVIHEGSA